MARAAWASKSQLLARLRPYAAPAGPGNAPTELLPELCGILRGLKPAEIRLVLSAYSGYASSSPAIQLSASKTSSTANHIQTSAAAIDADAAKKVTSLPDVLVQLLVGGSRLGSVTQLMEAAEAIAAFAPCDSRAAAQFWVVFAERAAKLAASNSLDAHQLSAVLAACADWEQRCGPAPGRESRRSSGGPWGHMLRSVGGRLADSDHLDNLSLQDVVAVARNAAHCGEPQHRLAAAVGFRVGFDGSESQHGVASETLSTQDLVDLIGAAGKLGGRLHMMTRALADRLEPQVAYMPAASIVQMCTHLGALEMFPQRIAATLEVILPGKLPQLKVHDLLLLLRVSGRLRWRTPAVLEPLLDVLREEARLDNLNSTSCLAALYELYRLDLWDEFLIEASCQRLKLEAGHFLPRKAITNALLALTYFSQPVPHLYQQLIQELLRAKDLPTEATFQLKTVEMAIRVGHAAVSFKELGTLAARWLFGIRSAASPPESKGESAFAHDVSEVAKSISWIHESEVEVGPYVLDFAAVAEDDHDEGEAPPGWDDRAPSRSLVRCCVALEADGPSHFYRPHGSPWHWTSSSKLRHRLLTASGIRVAHVPYYDWIKLESNEQKQAYLGELLLRTQQQPVRGRKRPPPAQTDTATIATTVTTSMRA